MPPAIIHSSIITEEYHETIERKTKCRLLLNENKMRTIHYSMLDCSGNRSMSITFGYSL
jgi:hypothetical protein